MDQQSDKGHKRSEDLTDTSTKPKSRQEKDRLRKKEWRTSMTPSELIAYREHERQRKQNARLAPVNLTVDQQATDSQKEVLYPEHQQETMVLGDNR